MDESPRRRTRLPHAGPVLVMTAFGMVVAADLMAANADEQGFPEEITLVHNIVYREEPSKSCTLDLAMPRVQTRAPRPAIVVIHGGGWIEGDKSSFSSREQRVPGNIIDFARLGFVAVTINYRLAGEAAYPAALDDCRCAVRWLRAHAAKYHIAVDRIGAWGNSAGGHLALLLGLTKPDELEADNAWRAHSSAVQAVASDSGPVDLIHQYEQGTLRVVVEKFLGGPPEGVRIGDYKRASPTNYIAKESPPLLLMYGVADNQVPVESADVFVTALAKAGAKDVSYHRLAGVDHCPHSLQRVKWLEPVVNEFFVRTLRAADVKKPITAGETLSPAPQRQLRPMLKIDWSRGPNLPQGLQDSDGGFLGSALISACGFCSGGLEEDNRQKPGRYPRGFLQKAWALDVAVPGAQWQSPPAFPGVARQGLFSVVVADGLYYWGGFSYSEPFCYANGWRLTRNGDTWSWHTLPPLPWRLTSSALGAVDGKIYLAGGADYDGVKGFYTEYDRNGDNPRLGARLLVIDTANLASGWKQLPDCPGTPRFVHTLQAVGGKLYLLGGATGDLARNGKKYGYCTVVDNWVYDPKTEQWSRLRDLPVSSGNFPKSSNLVYENRYIVLPGGHQYAYVANPDGTVRDKYGAASQKRPASGLHNDVFVYDTQADLFGTGDRLPIDNNLPMSVVRGDKVYLLGGETGGGQVEGEYYGHHPDLLLIGRLSSPR